MWRPADLVWTDHLQGRKIRRRGNSVSLSLQPPAHTAFSLADFSTLKMEAMSYSETSIHTRSTRRHNPEDGILLGSNCHLSFGTVIMAAAFISTPKMKNDRWSERIYFAEEWKFSMYGGNCKRQEEVYKWVEIVERWRAVLIHGWRSEHPSTVIFVGAK
jgi:hypothetical protein